MSAAVVVVAAGAAVVGLGKDGVLGAPVLVGDNQGLLLFILKSPP